MKLTHLHHIVPTHAGGTDDPANLIELTVEQHAAAHQLLWEKDGQWQDYIAWQALSGSIKSEEARRIATSKSNTGTFFITNGKENRRIRPGDEIPFGWKKGLTNKPAGYSEKISKALTGKKGPKRSKEFKENLKKMYAGRKWVLDPKTGKRVWI